MENTLSGGRGGESVLLYNLFYFRDVYECVVGSDVKFCVTVVWSQQRSDRS